MPLYGEAGLIQLFLEEADRLLEQADEVQFLKRRG